MNVAEIMKADVEVCGLDDNLAAVASRMWDADIGSLPVVSADGRVVGMVTDRDICMAAYTRGQALHQIPVSVAMSKEIFYCAPDTPLLEAELIMRSVKVHRLPVIDSAGSLTGIVSLNDLARLAGQRTGPKKPVLSAEELARTLAVIAESRSPDAKRTRF